ncbi:hypothetical protein AAFF_G00225880 [Aldrovandia affinis]|uniref:Uncharacterized protein n=1 Tax=Aldrovandia affinis TaxID=143900 RepID=A0AAD7TBA1_9TELE|nr:hypothetical protein AAFF_G00225880 [Aldrovandia affinis]
MKLPEQGVQEPTNTRCPEPGRPTHPSATQKTRKPPSFRTNKVSVAINKAMRHSTLVEQQDLVAFTVFPALPGALQYLSMLNTRKHTDRKNEERSIWNYLATAWLGHANETGPRRSLGKEIKASVFGRGGQRLGNVLVEIST